MKKSIIILCAALILVFFVTMGNAEKNEKTGYIRQFGWIVDEKSEVREEILIPDPLSDVYEKYNELQKNSGFDISKYCGKKAERYTYKVLNHKSGSAVFANIIIYEGKIIGADIMSRAIDGFMHEINRKEFLNAS